MIKRISWDEAQLAMYIRGKNKPAPIFINLEELTTTEIDIIMKMSDNWVYGKQIVLQEEFIKKGK